MTEFRLFAGWLRSITALAAVAGTLGLSGCGGGSGAPNNPFVGPLTVLPATIVAYSGVPTILTISGGTGPYKAFSSNPAVLPVTQAVPATTVVLLPGNVTADTDVTVTIQETGSVTPVGAQVPVTVSVRAAALGNALTITPNSAECGTNAICSGQNGTASVTLPGPQGPGRAVRFDVVGTAYAIVTNNPAQPLVSTLTVVSDANGTASVIIQANANAPTQFAQLRVTDVTSGQQVTGNFVIQQFTDGSTILSVVPSEATITGADTATCSSGFATDYYVYGGTPPYRITSTFPTAVTLVNSTVNAAGGFFRAITNGTCVDPLTFSILDATGRQTTSTLINRPGTVTPPPAPTAAPSATLSTPTPGTCNARTFSVLITGGTPPYNITASLPVTGYDPSASPSGPGYVSFTGLTDTNIYNFNVSDSAKPPLSAQFTIRCPVT